MYLTVKQQLKHLSKDEYHMLRELCHIAKNLHNQALYNIRQQYFEDGTYLSYTKNNSLLKSSENYRLLNSNMSQQILMDVDESFHSFFGLLKQAKAGERSFSECHIPRYLPKDGYTTLIVGFVRLKDNIFEIPFSNSYRKNHSRIRINIPSVLHGKTVKEIRIKPKADARFFEVHYTYEAECMKRSPDQTHALALDFGVNNLITGATNKGETFIVDGKKLKSINQWYNKRNASLQSIKDKQHYGKRITKKQSILLNKRNARVNDYLSKAARMVIEYCITHDIGTLIVGYNTTFQKNTNMGKANNQNFVNIPYGILRKKFAYLCELYSINYIEQEESYTSKASFFDRDTIPVYSKTDDTTYRFNGRRIKRGLYKNSTGYTYNADVNGALNIMRKSNVVSLNTLYARGVVDTPVRIRIA